MVAEFPIQPQVNVQDAIIFPFVKKMFSMGVHMTELLARKSLSSVRKTTLRAGNGKYFADIPLAMIFRHAVDRMSFWHNLFPVVRRLVGGSEVDREAASRGLGGPLG